jgi:lipopolysaccharide biosynthesis glycosyltransferase
MNRRNLIGIYKRMLFVFLFLIPVFVLIESLLGSNASSVTKISIYILVAGITLSVVELIRYKKMNK